jgi:LemA protein
MTIGFIIALAIGGGLLLLALIVGIWLISTYNGLVTLREQVKQAWAQIDVQLKRRYDLIPNLIETVKGYAKHEAGTLEAVMKARNAAVSAGSDPKAVGQAEGALTASLGRLFAVAEAYPDLKANTNFLQLQGELAATENQIATFRGGYNNSATTYNIKVQSFPTNLIAGIFGFAIRELFEVTDPATREAPAVKF